MPPIRTHEDRLALDVGEGLPGHIPLSVTTSVSSGTAVVSLRGLLDADTVLACRHTLDRVLRQRPAQLILDLGAVEMDGSTVAALGLIRRHVQRGGARLVLVALPRLLNEALHGAEVLDLYDVRPAAACTARKLTHPWRVWSASVR